MHIDGFIRSLRHILKAELQTHSPGRERLAKSTETFLDAPLRGAPVHLDTPAMERMINSITSMFNLSNHESAILRNDFASVSAWANTLVTSDIRAVSFTSQRQREAPFTVTYPLHILRGEARLWAQMLPVDTRRLVLMCSARGIFGFVWSCLVPQIFFEMHGKRLVVIELDIEDVSPSRFESKDLVLATSIVWEYFAKSNTLLPPECIGVNAGGGLADGVATKLRQRKDQLTFIEVYSTVATSGVGFRSNEGPYTLLDGLFKSKSHNDSVARFVENGTLEKLDLPDRLAWVSDQQFFVEGDVRYVD
jgi:hypothetical protein